MPHLFHARNDAPYSEGSCWSLGLEYTIEATWTTTCVGVRLGSIAMGGEAGLLIKRKQRKTGKD